MTEHTPAPAPTIGNTDTLTTRLRGRSLIVARVAWIAMALLVIAVFAVSIPPFFNLLRGGAPCATDSCAWHAEAASIQTLRERGISLNIWATLIVLQAIGQVIVWHLVGIAIFVRKSEEPAALFVALVLVLVSPNLSGTLYILDQHSAWMIPAKLVQLAGLTSLVLFFYLFPDGRFVPRWTRWLAMGSVAVWIGNIFLPGTPLNFDSWPLLLIVGFFFVSLGSGLAAQIYRYFFVAGPIQRQQTKWVVFAVATIIVGFIGGLFLLPLVSPSLMQPGSIYVLMVDPVLRLSWMLLPLSIGIAILRYRLYDIDIIINRALIYGGLTVALSLIYIGCIVVSRILVAPLTGGSELAIVISTLVIAALFMPLRRRIQNSIDKRFFRRKYDAAKVLATFGATVRDETDLGALSAEMLRIVDETMQPGFVGLWLRDPQAHSKTEAARPDSRPPR